MVPSGHYLSMSPPYEDAGAGRLTQIYQQFAPRVFGYAARRLPVGDAEEIVADTFLIAWRRLPDLPIEPLPWLLVVARNLIANHRRSTIQRERIIDVAMALEQQGSSGGASNTGRRFSLPAASTRSRWTRHAR